MDRPDRIINGVGSTSTSANTSNASTSMVNGECFDSISYLESAFHHGFMRTRLKTSDFVYHENPRLTRELDDFCDVDSMHQPKGPIILLGESGAGKTAFLANWIVRRKKMFQSWQSAYPEFLFTHVVGCTRQSCLVSSLLERLLREIKEFFELNKEIPDVEERLSWQFPRFLEAASKKGRVILIIDGLQRLRTNDGESILKWVPLAFPPNVRIIFTGTVNYPSSKFITPDAPALASYEKSTGGDHHEKVSLNAQMIERIKLEANRRNWTLVHMTPLSELDRHKIIKKFLHKYHPNRSEMERASSIAAISQKSTVPMSRPSLQLFEIQQKAITTVSMCSSPHFIKIFLSSLLWAVNEEFDIHTVFESWLSADSLGQLIEAILRSMELGYTPTNQATEDAKQFLEENGYSNLRTYIPSLRRRTRTDKSLLERSHSLESGAEELQLLRESALTADSPVTSSEIELKYDNVRRRSIDAKVNDGNHSRRNSIHRAGSAYETEEGFVKMTGRPATSILQSTTNGTTPSSSSGFNRFTLSGDVEMKHHDPTNPTRSSHDIPAYLSGGRYALPLKNLLGRALCLLFVCRHGMLINELRFVLNAVVTEASNEKKETYRVFRKASFARDKKISQEPLTAFSEDEWKALLRALKPLGVLFVQDVVVLPICNEILRDIVWWRYIGSEQVEQQYHQWMIRFFRLHPTTFRRVEELPWHLKRCYQWDGLRNVLVNLSMFELLYTANYKRELFGYWKTLTDGPLLIYNPSLVATTDTPAYAVTFDIVREYGKNIEDWYRTVRPPTKVFTPIIQLVTKFMFEFSLYYQGCMPQFSHAPFDLTRLYQDGFSFIEDLPHVQSSNSTTAVNANPLSGSTSTAIVSSINPMAPSTNSTLMAAIDSFWTISQGNVSNVTSKEKEGSGNWFFFYQRWIWIQFPWLALSKEILIREPTMTTVPVAGTAGRNNQQTNNPFTSTGIATDSSSFGMSASPDRLDAAEEEQQRANQDDELMGNLSSPHSQCNSRTVHFDARFWDVKKSMVDSSNQNKRKGIMSSAKIAAVQNSSILSSTPNLMSADVIYPENLFRKKTAYTAVKNVLSSSVRALPTAILNASGSLPALPEDMATNAEHSDTFLTDVPTGNNNYFSSAGLTVKIDTSMDQAKGGQTSLVTKDLVLEHLGVNDNITSLSTAFGLPAHFQDYPQSEWDLQKSYNHKVVLKLQTLYDNLKMEVHKKQSQLHSIKQKIKETKKRYDFMMSESEMARVAMDEMSSRMEKIEQMSKNIDKQEKNHRKLIRGCEMFPACDPSHFDAIKKELKLLRMKLKDLTEEKKVLQIKKSHLYTKELPVLRKAIEKSKQLLSAVVERLIKAREKMMHEHISTDKLYQHRLEMIETLHSTTATTADESQQRETTSVPDQLTGSTNTPSLAAKVALQQCESMCEKIQKATGYTKLEQIYQKFVSREELNRSFEEQAKAYETRLKQIKLGQAELEHQLQTLELSNATALSDDPRTLEEKVRVAEVELARVERTQNNLLTTSKEVIAGAARIVKLIGITSCQNPHHNAIPVLKLWPPPVGVQDGSNNLTSEFETLEPNAIAALLQICQDRAMLMIDAVEGGRGDPDFNFALAYDTSLGLLSPKTVRGEDKPLPKPSKVKKPHHNSIGSNTDKKERNGFDRGSVPPMSLTNALGPDIKHGAPEMKIDDEEENEDDVMTRENIKTVSKNKIIQKKRVPNSYNTSVTAINSLSSTNSIHHLDME